MHSKCCYSVKTAFVYITLLGIMLLFTFYLLLFPALGWRCPTHSYLAICICCLVISGHLIYFFLRYKIEKFTIQS